MNITNLLTVWMISNVWVCKQCCFPENSHYEWFLTSTSAMKILLQHNILINWHCPFLGDNFGYFPVVSSWQKTIELRVKKTVSYDSLMISACLPSLLFSVVSHYLATWEWATQNMFSKMHSVWYLPMKNTFNSYELLVFKIAWWLWASICQLWVAPEPIMLLMICRGLGTPYWLCNRLDFPSCKSNPSDSSGALRTWCDLLRQVKWQLYLAFTGVE